MKRKKPVLPAFFMYLKMYFSQSKRNMQNFTPLSVLIRVFVYALLMLGVAEAVRFDAMYPMEDGYFGEISLTEIFQEIILFILFGAFLWLGYMHRPMQTVCNFVSLFFLISFIREFNFLIDWWVYPSLAVFLIIGWLVVRDFKKIKKSTGEFFAQPAGGWFLSGIMVTYVFSRLFGRSSFWLVLYDENNYRLAKAATEEGLELLGDVILLIAAIEYLVNVRNLKRRNVR